MSSEYKDKYRSAVASEIRRNSVLTRIDEALSAADNAALALNKLSEHLAQYDFSSENPCEACGRKGMSVEAAGKTQAYIAKVLNETTRLLQFERGKADSRTEVVGVADLMRALTNEQFEQVDRWYREGLERDAANRGPH